MAPERAGDPFKPASAKVKVRALKGLKASMTNDAGKLSLLERPTSMSTCCDPQSCSLRPVPPVRVVVCDSPPLPHMDGLSPLEQKRRVWHDAPRNALIARVAQALAASTIEPLWDAGLLLDETMIEYSSVAVLVESAEHGRDLARHLPDWPMLHCIPGMAVCAAETTLTCAIVTLTAAKHLMCTEPEALVMAAGGHWAPMVFSAAQPLRTPQRLLVDVMDGDDQICDRLWEYRARGWHLDIPRRLADSLFS